MLTLWEASKVCIVSLNACRPEQWKKMNAGHPVM